MLNKIKRNDEVMTSGGIYGKVIEIKDQVVTLEVAPNVRIRVNRPQISAVITAEKAQPKTERINGMRRGVLTRVIIFSVLALLSVLFLAPNFLGKKDSTGRTEMPDWWPDFCRRTRFTSGSICKAAAIWCSK